VELYPLLAGESIEIRAFPIEPEGRRIQHFVESWESVDPVTAQLDVDHDVYFGVCPRVPDVRGHLRGTAENVTRCPVVWLDLDAKGAHSKDDRLRQLEEAPPTLLVDSGGGFHAFWRLDQDASPQTARRVMKRMEAFFDSDPVSDPSRILRWPGTRNYKYDPPRFVDIVREDRSGRVWNLLELPQAEVLEEERLPTDREKRAHIIANGIPKGGVTINGETFSGRDAAIFEYACYLRDEQHDQTDVLKMCQEANHLMQPPLETNVVAVKVQSAFTREPAPIITEVIEAAPPLIVPTQTPRAKVMSLKEIVSFEEPPIEFLAKGMFGRSSIEFIAHPPKSGKTTVALNWGLRLAAGMTGAGLLEVACPYRVLFWQPNADMSPRRTREWIRQIRHGLGLSEDLAFDFWYDDGNSRLDENLRALEERCDDYDLVIIDSLNRFLPGVDAADTDVVAGSFNCVRRLRTVHPEVCWSYIVQVGKNSSVHLGSQNPAFALRGNSAVAEAYDTMIQLATPKNTEKDATRGLSINRHVLFHGRDSDIYRGPFRTRYNLDTHVLEWETDLTPDEALGEIDGTDRESRRTQRDEAVDLLRIIFNDAEEEYGERKVKASEVYDIGQQNGLSKKVMGSAFKSMGGSFEGSGKNSVWVDFDVEVVEP
jgi:hypothetical protein